MKGHLESFNGLVCVSNSSSSGVLKGVGSYCSTVLEIYYLAVLDLFSC
jgi:hypothetical protein